jgi:seryl-tRNA synthetase
MQNTQIEDIKAEAMTLARRTKHIANNLETMAQELQQITQKIDDLTLKIANLQTTQQEAKPDPSDPKLIEEWIEYNGSDFDSDIEEIMDCSLDVNHYSSQVEVTIEKEINDYNRDSLLTDAITKYLEWAAEKKNEVQEDTNND